MRSLDGKGVDQVILEITVREDLQAQMLAEAFTTRAVTVLVGFLHERNMMVPTKAA